MIFNLYNSRNAIFKVVNDITLQCKKQIQKGTLLYPLENLPKQHIKTVIRKLNEFKEIKFKNIEINEEFLKLMW